MLTITIDGIRTEVPEGTLVIEAARQVGVMVPHFCYHPKLAPDANCRMCLVEIEKIPKLQTSCSTRVAEGMVVRSSVPHVENARKWVLQLLLGNHPLDCPVCDQGGRCDLAGFFARVHAHRQPVQGTEAGLSKTISRPRHRNADESLRVVYALRAVLRRSD